jgi:hypothetical protein
MTRAFIESVGLIAPGLPSWEVGRSVLAGGAPFQPAPLAPVQPHLLPPNERRRAPLAVRMALAAAADAMAGTDLPAAALASVFASSDADMQIVHRISSALAEPARSVSPTDFHNSVHNAASGYWSIAVGSHAPSTTVAAYDFIFTAGLRETLEMLAVEGGAVLLVIYDVPPPEPLYATRPIEQPAAISLALSAERTARSLAAVDLDETGSDAALTEATLRDPALETLRQTNPAARALPLLQRLAQCSSATIGIAADDEMIAPLRVRIL